MALSVEQVEERLKAGGHRVTIGQCTDIKGCAAIVGCSVRTLRAWNAAGDGPPCLELSAGLKLYPLAAVMGWLAGRVAAASANGRALQITADCGKRDVA